MHHLTLWRPFYNLSNPSAHQGATCLASKVYLYNQLLNKRITFYFHIDWLIGSLVDWLTDMLEKPAESQRKTGKWARNRKGAGTFSAEVLLSKVPNNKCSEWLSRAPPLVITCVGSGLCRFMQTACILCVVIRVGFKGFFFLIFHLFSKRSIHLIFFLFILS